VDATGAKFPVVWTDYNNGLVYLLVNDYVVAYSLDYGTLSNPGYASFLFDSLNCPGGATYIATGLIVKNSTFTLRAADANDEPQPGDQWYATKDPVTVIGGSVRTNGSCRNVNSVEHHSGFSMVPIDTPPTLAVPFTFASS
jgi:hypothetical protein